MNVGEIEYTVSVETQQSINAAQQFDKQMDQVQDSARKTDRELGKLDSGFSRLATAIKGVIAVSALKSMAGMVQQYQTMAERVKMATHSTEEFETVQKRLQTTADGTYRSLAEAQELYIRTADSIRSMGYTLEETIDIQDSMSYAFVTNATSADRAQAAISQFTKSINTGKVSADQWETISSAIPTVMNDIAAASGKSASEVRALGAAGKLTARELTEGLRKSLDETRAASDNMATDLIDASVRAKNAITTVLVGLENQTGAIQAVTDGIIAASEVMLDFGQDAEKMESFLQLVTVAGASLAAVMAGRLITSMGAFAASAASMTGQAIVARNLAASNVALAQTELANAQAASAAATARAASSVGLAHHKIMVDAAAAAAARLAAAQTGLSAANTTLAGTAGIATLAINGMRAAMAFLGGPVGVAMLAAIAIYTYTTRAKEAKQPTTELRGEVDRLRESFSDLAAEEAAAALLDYNAALVQTQLKAVDAADNVKHLEQMLERYPSDKRVQTWTEALIRSRGEMVSARKEVALLIGQIEKLELVAGAPARPKRANGEPPEETTTPEGQKRLQAMRDEIELAKRVGVARARLAAAQRLGADATPKERAEAERLATELYNLEKAQVASKKATEAAGKAAEDAAQKLLDAAKSDEEVIAALNEQLYQTTLTADELRKRQAELQLSKYATPEQIADVHRLAQAIGEAEQKAADLERRRSAFGTDTAGAITGSVSPLSGGMFDDQTARYEAEAAAEQQRYADAMARLQEAKELELEVKGGYMALEEQMAQEHADRMQQIEDAKTQVMMQSAGQGLGAVADIMKTAFGEQSALYKAAFVAQKAAAIAQSVVAIQQGMAMAAANPWPANLGAIASVAAATAGIVSTIASTQVGSRRHGGPVAAGSMYRVNEGGAPEIFQNNLGQQYMVPNSDGEVISNKDASKGGGGNVFNVTISVEGAMSSEQARQQGFEISESFVQGVRSVIGGELQAGGSIWQAVR